MEQSRDYYDVLGVGRDADAKTIKEAFRNLSLKYHPDRNQEPGAEDRFKEMAEAYAVLSDPKKRKAYDARGFAGVADFSPEDLFGGLNVADLFGGLGFGGGLGGGLFDRFRRPSGPVRGRNIEVIASVPLDMIASGGEWPVHVGHPQQCRRCSGTGAKPGTSPRKCQPCSGTGKHVESRREGNVAYQQVTACRVCAGRGTIVDEPCPSCAGAGTIAKDVKLTVKVPAGVEDGMALRVPGRGLPSPDPGGMPGDLLVVVRTASDPRFRRVGADLWRNHVIDDVDAVLGTKIEVPTLEGSVSATVPASTQPDAILRIAGKGLPLFGRAERGDLYVKVIVEVPATVSNEERALYEKLRELRSPNAGALAESDVPTEDTMEDRPAEDAAAEEGPAEDAAAEEGPAEDDAADTPVEDGPAEDGPSEDGPGADNAPANDLQPPG